MRAETRGGAGKAAPGEEVMGALFSEEEEIVGDWKRASEHRFPESFRTTVSSNAQQIILWCLERPPKHRLSAKQLLTCNLLPRKVELEEKNLNEVLQTLSNPQSELQSYQQILHKFFDFPTPNSVLTTYDSEVSINANKIDARLLAKSLNTIKGSHWTAHSMSCFSPMSSTAVVAAISALGRVQHVGTISGSGKEGEGRLEGYCVLSCLNSIFVSPLTFVVSAKP